MSYIPDIRSIKWVDLSPDHKKIRKNLETAIKEVCVIKSSKANPIMVKGAFGSGKTNALSYALTYAWAELNVPAFFIDLEKIIQLIDLELKAIEGKEISCSKLIEILEAELQRMIDELKVDSNWTTINGFSNHYNEKEPINSILENIEPLVLTELLDNEGFEDKKLKNISKEVITLTLSNNNKALIIIDEFEDKYPKLKQRLEYAGGGIIRELFEYAIKKDSKFYLLIGNGPASGYELSEGTIDDKGGTSAQDRRLDVLNVPTPDPKMLEKSFLKCYPVGYINFIWWLSRARPGLIAKSKNQLPSFDKIIEDDYISTLKNYDILTQNVDSQNETVKFINADFINDIPPLIKNNIFKDVLFNLSPTELDISEIKDKFKDCAQYFIGSKKCTKRDDIISSIESDLISKDATKKVSLNSYKSNNRFSNAEWNKIKFYLNLVLSAMADEKGMIAYGLIVDDNWKNIYVTTFLKPLLQLVYDFIVQYEDTSTKEILDTCDYLLEIISIVEKSGTDGTLDQVFSGIVYKDIEEETKFIKTTNISNNDNLILQLSPFAIKEIFEQPIGEPKLTYKNRQLNDLVCEIKDFDKLIRHFDGTKNTEIIFIPDLLDEELLPYLSNLDKYITANWKDKYLKQGGLSTSIVYLAENELISNFQQTLKGDEGEDSFLFKLGKISFANIDSFDLTFSRQAKVFIDSLCKIGLIENNLAEPNTVISDDKDDNFISLSKICDYIKSPTWSDRKEVRRTVEHYARLIFEGEKSTIAVMTKETLEKYEEGIKKALPNKEEIVRMMDSYKVDYYFFKKVSDVNAYTKNFVSLFLIENNKLNPKFETIIKGAVDITGRKSEDIGENDFDFLKIKLLFDKNKDEIKALSNFDTDNTYFNELKIFYSEISNLNIEITTIEQFIDILKSNKSFIKSYHDKLGALTISEEFSVALFNLNLIQNLDSEKILNENQELNQTLKETLGNSITELTTELSNFKDSFGLEKFHINYDDDALNIQNKIIVALSETIESDQLSSYILFFRELKPFLERVNSNVSEFKNKLHAILESNNKNKEILKISQDIINGYFADDFNKKVLKFKGVSQSNFSDKVMKRIKNAEDYEQLFGSDKKYSQKTNQFIKQEDVNKLISIISTEYQKSIKDSKALIDEIEVEVGVVAIIDDLVNNINSILKPIQHD